ncbi:MAG: hypothetical protein COA42_23260 [Alteromonadaceae bacterium]|nr:MAG: hypothetical protein COA42_23260 [Alteromonadaceae bacterium]
MLASGANFSIGTRVVRFPLLVILQEVQRVLGRAIWAESVTVGFEFIGSKGNRFQTNRFF